MLSELSLHNKVAVVTGATGLLGKEHCLALAEAGATVYVADISFSAAEQFCSEHTGLSFIPLALDVRNKQSIQTACDVVRERSGKIDILVNNAAMNDMVERRENSADETAFEVYPEELFRAVMDVNVTGVFLCCQIFGALMLQNGSGSIINIASTYGITAPDQSIYVRPDGTRTMYKSAAYPASKGAVIMLTKFLASYWGDKNIRVNALSPGGVENGQEEYFVHNYSQKVPLGRMAKRTDYRGGILFLASDASAYMTGANLVIDGGWTCI